MRGPGNVVGGKPDAVEVTCVTGAELAQEAWPKHDSVLILS